VKRAALGAVCVLAVLATALAWPASRPPREPLTRVLAVAVTPGSGPEAVGSGFAVGPGRVVTVAHLLEGRSRIEVRGPGRPARRARLLRLDRRTDLALLAVPGLRGRSLRTADAGAGVRLLLLRDERAMTRPARVRRHIEAHVHGADPHSLPALELAARIAAGDSGAPVVGAGGEVTGVLFARSRDHLRTAYAVDASAVEGLIRRRGSERPRTAP
jgi:S1-C subfamily serine protease